MNVLSVRDLSVAYQGVDALAGVFFDAAAGDYIGIVGPNGSGKTTLVKTLVGLLSPSAGEVSILGMARAEFADWSRIGYLPQKTAPMDPRFPANVEEIVASGLLAVKPFPKVLDKKDRERIGQMLDLLGIADLRAQLIGRLSGGQQQRVMLARSLVNRPAILILDEPIVALDPQTRDSFYLLLQKLNREEKMTVLFVSHDPVTVGRYANKLLYLDKKVIFFGTFDAFCHSEGMTAYFGPGAQHMMCNRHG